MTCSLYSTTVHEEIPFRRRRLATVLVAVPMREEVRVAGRLLE
jgi:hypothetical protein